jgi:hypothetical protein
MVVTVTALVAVGFSFDDEPTFNSNDELTVARSCGGGKMMAAEAPATRFE